ncbi:MAG: DUF222 domain-containing protein [Nitriliruptorales bacterium]
MRGGPGEGRGPRRRCEAHRFKGHRSGAQWLARTLGTSPKEAATRLETAKAVESLAATYEAFVAGRISEAQVAEVAKAATVDPSAEVGLLEVAEHADWRSLKDQVRQVRLKRRDITRGPPRASTPGPRICALGRRRGHGGGALSASPRAGRPAGQPYRRPDRPRIPQSLAAGRA